MGSVLCCWVGLLVVGWLVEVLELVLSGGVVVWVLIVLG